MAIHIVDSFNLASDLPLDNRYIINSIYDVSKYWYDGMLAYDHLNNNLWIVKNASSGLLEIIKNYDASISNIYVYIDGSLSTRDISLGNLSKWEVAQDSSISSLRTYVDGSLNNKVSKTYVDGSLNNKVSKTGDIMTGTLYVPMISDVSYINFNPAIFENSVGRLGYDSIEGTLSFGILNGSIQIGKETFDYYTNLSGVTLLDGDVVSIIGVSGNRIAVTLTDARNYQLAASCIGVVTDGSANNQKVRVTKIGDIHGLNTLSLTEGLPAYVDPLNPGKLTQTAPSAPNAFICVGLVSVSHANQGILSVDIRISTRLTELSDVDGTPLLTTGQIPVWHSDTSVFDFDFNINNYTTKTYVDGSLNARDISLGNLSKWEVAQDSSISSLRTYVDASLNNKLNKQIAIDTHFTTGHLNRTDSSLSFNSANRVFTIHTTNGFVIYSNGTKFIKTQDTSIQIADLSTLHFIYFDGSANLRTNTSGWSIVSENSPTATVYWNGTNGALSDERHNAGRNLEWHQWAHDTIGTRYESGLSGIFTNASTYIASGTLHDEDIDFNSPIQNGTCRIWYRFPGGQKMTFDGSLSARAAKIIGTNLQYDNNGTLTTVPGNGYVTNWVYATLDVSYNIMVVTSQSLYNTGNDVAKLAAARAATLPVFPNVITAELKLIYQTIWKQVGAVPTLMESTDYRTSSVLPGGGTQAVNAQSVSFTAAGNISSTNVQSAIEELDGEKVSKAGDIMTGNLQLPSLTSTGDVSITGILRIDNSTKSLDTSAGSLIVKGGIVSLNNIISTGTINAGGKYVDTSAVPSQILFVDVSTYNNQNLQLSHTVGLSQANVGDIRILAISETKLVPGLAPSMTIPSGWTEIDRKSTSEGSGVRMGVIYKIVGASDGVTQIITCGSTVSLMAICTSYTGVDASNPLNGSAPGFSLGFGKFPLSPSITTTVNNTRVVRFLAADNDSSVSTLYEAEAGTIIGTTPPQIVVDTSASGGAKIGFITIAGDGVTVNNVNGGIGGYANMNIRYSSNNVGTVTFSVYVNTIKQIAPSFPTTGGLSNFAVVDASVLLLAGTANTITLKWDVGDGKIDIDRFIVTSYNNIISNVPTGTAYRAILNQSTFPAKSSTLAGQGLGVADAALATAGSIGTAQWTLDASEEWVYGTIALNPGISYVYKPLAFPTDTSVSGNLFYRSDLEMLFGYDNQRKKWLSVDRQTFSAGRDFAYANVETYLLVGSAITSSLTGYRMPKNGTITSLSVQSEILSGDGARTLQIKINGALSNAKLIMPPSTYGVNKGGFNVDVSAGDFLSFSINGGSELLTNVIANAEVAWRE